VCSQEKKSKRKYEGTSAVEPVLASKRQKQSEKKKKSEESVEYRPEGFISSLFFNNPDIPAFARRVVKPVSEPVFSSQNFRDLPIHRFTVSDANAFLCRRIVFE
jgi:ATP-dependent RNA helicase DDX31/DBP7